MKYAEYKKLEIDMYNENPYVKYAFGEEQLREVMEEWNLKYPQDKEKLISIYGCGDLMQEKDLQAYKGWQKETFTKLNAIKKEAMTDYDFCYDMFYSEMSNIEYGISMDDMEVLRYADITLDALNENKILLKAFDDARTQYLRDFEKLNW